MKDTNFPLELKLVIEYYPDGSLKYKSYEPDISNFMIEREIVSAPKEFFIRGIHNGCFQNKQYVLKSNTKQEKPKIITIIYVQKESERGSLELASMKL